MKYTRVFVFAMVIPGMIACSKESMQRTGYDTLQNVGQQQCEQDLSADCPERKSYDEYQEELKDSDVAQ
jgi:hypothetical protein